jgi:ABC-type multidrug transport system fused ATPase/permease subunit
MYNPSKIINKIKYTIKNIFSLKVVSIKRTVFLISLSFLVILFDALSIVSVMPLIQFIQYDLNVNEFIINTEYGERLYKIFSIFSISFNLSNLAIILFVLVILRQCFSYILVIEKQKTALTFAKDLSIKCFVKIMRAKAEYIRKINTGQFSIITEYECLQVATIYNYMLSFVSLATQVFAYVIAMMIVSFFSTLGAITIITIIVLLLMHYIYKANIQGKIVVNIRKSFYNTLGEEFSLWRLIKFRSLNNDIVKNIRPIAEKYAKSQLLITKYRERAKLFIILIAISSLSILLVLSIEIFKVDYSKLTFFGLIFIRLVPLGKQVNSALAHMAQIEPSLEVVKNTINDATLYEENIYKGKEFSRINKYIKFKNVTFNYPGSSYNALSNINIKIPAEKITAVIGKSGVGKSTLIDMLPRIIHPSTGKIYIDDNEINNYSISSLRKSISYISQESILFEGTIKENIFYFNDKVTNQEFEEILILSGVCEFINNFEERENYNIGEKGKNLSGGQKQRIILARAFSTNASILILDEATSALDIETEKHIKKALINLIKVKRMTVIIISHRNAIIYDADHIIHMRNENNVKDNDSH